MATSCDPSSLANAARCFDSCIPEGAQRSVKTYLLCQFSNVAVGPGSHILTENSIIINAENGNQLIVE